MKIKIEETITNHSIVYIWKNSWEAISKHLYETDAEKVKNFIMTNGFDREKLEEFIITKLDFRCNKYISQFATNY
ncbi:hypothetical protein [Clostridium perfringens]|uniref:hypothetical protein n=1 Tax=Clostridium perfringens TaxID=1502 RepID=UPI003747FDC7